MRTFNSPSALASATGTEFGPTDWITIDQARISAFADATDDHQWIHVDADRAAQGPYGSTIAHGYLTLSLLPRLVKELIAVGGVTAAINYGSDKVRFLAPVPAGGQIRARTVVQDVHTESASARVTFTTTVELGGSVRPALVATHISLYRFQQEEPG
jgi:acyl dehydratase